MSQAASFALDHIIILLPAHALDGLPKVFTDAFTITSGGTHGDGKTYNKLVILGSGVYLELIAFVKDDPSRREGHWWGRKHAGTIIDWALTSSDVKDLEHLTKSGTYDEPKRGGRRRPDGKEVEWLVTFPNSASERGSVPFFCHDVTPRGLRVPESGTSHPSGAVHVERVVVVAAKDKLSHLVTAYHEILGDAHEQGHEYVWRVQEPLSSEHTASADTVIELREAKTVEEMQVVNDNGGVAGVKEIGLFCDGATESNEVEVSFGGRTIRINLIAAKKN